MQASSNQYYMGGPGNTCSLCAADLPVGPPFTSLVVVVSGQQLLRDGAHSVGSYLQGQDEWHPLHFGVSPEWLWYSAPAVSPRWCGLL